jgi:hypothetical protein
MTVSMRVRGWWAAVERYAAHADPRVTACNWIALIVASNQPFYPLYVEGVAGTGGFAAMLTFLSTPFFALAPLVARRNDRIGRAMLPLAGIANSLLAFVLFGQASGVLLFLAPCIVIAGLAFRPDERRWSFALIGLSALAYFAGPMVAATPVVALNGAASLALLGVNVFSAGCLLALTGLTFSGAMADIRARSRA